MRRAIFVTQRLDDESPMFAAAVPKAAALARRVDELVVVCDSATRVALPDNVRVRTFGARSRAARAARFNAALAAELRPRPVAAIAHMVPLYVLAATPVLRSLGVPVVLWYTHWDDHRVLRLSERVATAITSVDTRSFPFTSPKVHGTGHGIDLAQFPPVGATRREGPFTALVAGRYAKRKGLTEVLRAARLLLDRGSDVRIVLRGPTMSPEEESVKRELERLAAELELGDAVELGGVVARAELPELFARVDALVCNHISPDKIVYEAAASCLPVLVSHPAFDDILADVEPSLFFAHADPQSLADRLAGLAAAPLERRLEIGRTLRDRVAARHSVDHWAEAMLACASGAGPAAARGTHGPT